MPLSRSSANFTNRSGSREFPATSSPLSLPLLLTAHLYNSTTKGICSNWGSEEVKCVASAAWDWRRLLTMQKDFREEA
jgi:hypothetical protein